MKTTTCLMTSLLAASTLVWAQGPAPNNGGWRKVGDPPRSQSADSSNPPYPADPNPPAGSSYDPNYAAPSQLTIPAGTFVTVRIDQPLSSDHNQPGDAFSATLVKPVVVDGVVVAQRGQTLGGRVVEAQKAGRVEGVSRLGIQLTDMSLVDGQQVPIQSQLISRTGPTSVGRDVGAVAGTTALGAAIGAAADWGRGAAIGAAAGAIAGTVGVLLTRGHATVIYPEQVLTFRIEAPVAISTARSQQAFRYVEPNDYERPYEMQTRAPAPACAGYGCAPPPYYYYGYYGPGYYPYYYGPGFGFFWGPRYYGGPRFYGGRGYYRGYRR